MATFKVDTRIHDDVLDEIALHPRLDVASIDVAVDAGVVTLTGEVDTFAQKWAATDAAQRAAGVRRVENKLTVWTQGLPAGKDAAIAGSIEHTLALLASLPVDRIGVAVRDGQVRLFGSVDRQWQRTAAYYAALGTPGVTGVTSDLALAALPLAVVGGGDTADRALVREVEVSAA